MKNQSLQMVSMPIIDKALRDKVQFKRQESRKKPQVHGKGTNLLTGIVKCPKCEEWPQVIRPIH